jgi:hypothetical protein
MTFDSADAPASAYTQAWVALALVFVYYLLATALLNWIRGKSISVTKYEPPQGLSPAIASYLCENGRCERAFAAAIVSLAVKRYLEIRQNKDWFTLKRLREPDDSLTPEESSVLSELFPVNDVYKFDGRENSRLYRAFEKFENVVEQITEPRLMSPHDWTWAVGAGALVFIAGLLALALPLRENRTSLGSVAFVSIWVALGGYCLMAALRVWPATLKRLASFLPQSDVPRRPLGWNDLLPVWLTATAALAFAFLAAVTSPRFAIFVLAGGLLAFVFRHLLEAPTAQGRKLISELGGFREFLSRADTDRLNRANEAGSTPQSLERYSAYALALDVEHSWGEEFAADLLEMLQFDRAVDYRAPATVGGAIVNGISNIPQGDDDSIIHLNLGSKK